MGTTHRHLARSFAGACLLTAAAAQAQLVVADGGGTLDDGRTVDGQLAVVDGGGDDGGRTVDGKLAVVDDGGDDDGRTLAGGLKAPGGGGPHAIEYFDQTPICNYLDRGIDDQAPGKRDWHVVMPPGVQTLSDIDHVAFGLDLPATRCQDNPRSIPCSDDTDPRTWCVRRVELQVLGLKLLDMSGPTDGCLLTAKGGEGDAGIIGLDSAMLRLNNPAWGISEDELDLLINSVSLGIAADGTPTPTFLPPQITFSGEFISRSVESVVGNFFTRDAIGCANDLFCGHRRMLDMDGGDGELPLMPVLRWANADEVDCDLGDCNSTSSRRSNPWLELAGAEVGNAIHLTFDLDFAADRTGPDLGDCSAKDQTDPWDVNCGTHYTMVARGSIQTTAALECRAMATAAGQRLPYCAHADDGERCFQPALMGTWGTISCPPGDGWDQCGETGDLDRIAFDQRMRVVDFGVDLEDGWVVHAGDFLCTLFGCDLDDLVEGFMGPVVSQLEAGLVAVPLFSDLEGCPAVAVESDGTLTINPQQLDNCPEGINNPACDQLVVGGGGGGGGGLRGVGGLKVVEDDAGADPYGNFNFTVNLGSGDAGGYVIGAPEPVVAREGRDGGIDQLVADTPKIPMSQLDDALDNLCALRASCDPALDLRALPLRQMAMLNPNSLQGLEADPAGAMAAFGFLAESDAFRTGCLEWADPGYDGSSAPANALQELQFLSALQTWYADRFAVALDGPAPGEADPVKAALPDCRAITPGIEEVLPALGMVLTVTTGDGSVTDRFAFVNFKKPADVTAADRAVAGCGFRHAVGLPLADAPRCGDNGEIADGPGEGWGIECGRVAGGPCADITAEYYWGGFPFGPYTNDPAHETLHPNGNYSWHHRCAEHHENGEPMVCVADFYPGAGNNTWPTCKICGTPPEGEDPDHYTMIGCEPEGMECPQDLMLGLDGKCWDVTEGKPAWECAADCQGLYGDTGYCLHTGNWLDYMRNHSAIVGGVADTEGPPHQAPICADWHCPDSGIRCGWQGEACFNGDSCVTECITDADCHSVANGAPAYSAAFVCGPENTCVLP